MSDAEPTAHFTIDLLFLDHERDRQPLAVPHVVDRDLLVRTRLHGLDEVREIENRLTVDSHDPVAGLQTRRFRRTVVFDAADVGRQVAGAEGPETEALEQHAGLRQPPRIGADVYRDLALPAVLGLERQRNATVRDHLVEHGDECRFPVRGLDRANSDNPVALLESGLRRVRILRHFTDGRYERGDSVKKQRPVRHDGEQEIEGWSGEKYGDPLRYRPLVERPPLVRFGNGALAGIEKADVAAERNRRNTVFGAILTADSGPDRSAEPDRKPQHLHTGPAPHDVVTVLVNRHEDADGDDESQQIAESATHSVECSFSKSEGWVQDDGQRPAPPGHPCIVDFRRSRRFPPVSRRACRPAHEPALNAASLQARPADAKREQRRRGCHAVDTIENATVARE